MIIVSDSGPLAYLVEIGVAECLPTLYGRVFIPPSVMAELRHARCPASDWAQTPPDWLSIAKPESIPSDLVLDEGEREAIALALELGAEFLLMDEKKGRSAATARGLKVAGTLAVILDGAAQEVLNGLQALERLEKTTFYASDELLQAIRAKLEQRQSLD